jgi:hypothetical protein
MSPRPLLSSRPGDAPPLLTEPGAAARRLAATWPVPPPQKILISGENPISERWRGGVASRDGRANPIRREPLGPRPSALLHRRCRPRKYCQIRPHNICIAATEGPAALIINMQPALAKLVGNCRESSEVVVQGAGCCALSTPCRGLGAVHSAHRAEGRVLCTMGTVQGAGCCALWTLCRVRGAVHCGHRAG